jgi:hypothetical protein
MSGFWLLGLNLLPIVCVYYAANLLVHGVPEWWWFLGAGILTSVLPRLNGKKKEE